MKAVKITDKVYWVGAVDWNLRDFHGYTTEKGSTYNAYLVLGEKTVLIDTVKEPFYDEMMSRIASVIDPEKIDIIISNHAEMDHSGALPRAAAAIKPSEIYASQLGLKNLDLQLHDDLKIKTVKSGDSIDIGGDKITFTESRMLHWPDSMVSFLEREGVLFSNDIFGMHYAVSKMFDDENDEKEWYLQAKKYYANIITPYSDIALAFLESLEKSGFLSKVKIIAPDHGFIWRKDLSKIISYYKEWAAQKPSKKAVVIYDSMWGSTDLLARAVADGLRQGGLEVKKMSMHVNNRSNVVTEVLGAGAVVFGSPVMNSYLFPSIGDVLFYMKGLKFKNLKGAAFGSYGWAPAPIDALEQMMKEMKVDIVQPALKINFVPREQDLAAAEDFGRKIAASLNM
jgi:flavorubredoxin